MAQLSFNSYFYKLEFWNNNFWYYLNVLILLGLCVRY